MWTAVNSVGVDFHVDGVADLGVAGDVDAVDVTPLMLVCMLLFLTRSGSTAT